MPIMLRLWNGMVEYAQLILLDSFTSFQNDVGLEFMATVVTYRPNWDTGELF